MKRLKAILGKDKNLRGIADGAVRSFTIHFFGLGLAYGMQVALARWLGASGYGIYGLVLAWVTLLGTASALGLPLALLRLVPEYMRNRPLLATLIANSYRATFVAGTGCAAAGTIVVVALRAGMSFELRSAFLIGLWIVPIFAIGEMQTGAARGLRRPVLALAPSQLARPLLIILGVFATVFLTNTATGPQAVAVTLGAMAVPTVWQGIRLSPRWWSDVRTRAEFHIWRRVAIPLWLLAMFHIVSDRADVMVIGFFLNPTDVGIYHAASRVAGLTTLGLAAVNTLAAPTFASLHARGDMVGLGRTAIGATHMSFWPALVIGVGLLVFGEQILRLFGPEFSEAKWELAILAGGQIVNAGVGSVGHLLNLTGHQNQTLKAFATSSALNLALNLVLVPAMGIRGAAIASAITITFWNLLLHYQVRQRLGIRSSIVAGLSRRGPR